MTSCDSKFFESGGNDLPNDAKIASPACQELLGIKHIELKNREQVRTSSYTKLFAPTRDSLSLLQIPSRAAQLCLNEKAKFKEKGFALFAAVPEMKHVHATWKERNVCFWFQPRPRV